MKSRVLSFLIFASFLTLNLATRVSAYGADGEGILLGDVKTLTLHHGRQTTYRRTSPVPQVKCVGGRAQGSWEPTSVQCENKGFDGHDYQWRCEADMPKEYRFGSLTVTCEGYEHPDDPYVLPGSCGLEYTLEYTNESGKSFSKSNKGIFIFILIAVGVYFLFFRTRSSGGTPPEERERGRNDWGSGGGGGGGGWGGGNNWGSGGGGGGWRGRGSSCRTEDLPEAAANNFLGGAAMGGLMGYLWARNRNPDYGLRHYNYHDGPMGYRGPTWGGFGGGGGGGGGGIRAAAGFGGTRRR